MRSSKFIKLENNEEDDLKLLRAVARGEPLTVSGSLPPAVVMRFVPVFKHPLPSSNHKYKHEAVLRRVTSCSLEKQAKAAITLGDAWTLEEVYMRGAPVDIKDENGFTPLHIACQLNNFDATMVLLNIVVDCNATSLAGFTPLYLALAAKATQCAKILEENGALVVAKSDQSLNISSEFLDFEYPNENNTILDVKAKSLSMPRDHDMY